MNPVRLALGLLLLGSAAWGVLHAGGALTAPEKLAETWHVTVATDGCAALGDTITLSQSGVFLDVTWPGARPEHLHGRLEGAGTTLTGTSACGGTATLTGAWSPGVVNATLSAPACSACPQATLRAEPAGAPVSGAGP
jgi:hypothetical protein